MTSGNQSAPASDSDEVIVSVLKHNGAEYRRWRGRIAEQAGPLIVLAAMAGIARARVRVRCDIMDQQDMAQ